MKQVLVKKVLRNVTFLLLAISTFVMASCNLRQNRIVSKIVKEINHATVVYTPDISIKNVNGMRYAYYNGQLYTGMVYSSDRKSAMEIQNGLAIVAYANYGVHEGKGWEKEMAIYQDLNSLKQKAYEIQKSGSAGEYVAFDLFDTPKIIALQALPNCSFSNGSGQTQYDGSFQEDQNQEERIKYSITGIFQRDDNGQISTCNNNVVIKIGNRLYLADGTGEPCDLVTKNDIVTITETYIIRYGFDEDETGTRPYDVSNYDYKCSDGLGTFYFNINGKLDM